LQHIPSSRLRRLVERLLLPIDRRVSQHAATRYVRSQARLGDSRAPEERAPE
jgi:hypothetical protein